MQNVEAAKFLINKIYPLLTKNNPNINVVIAGQNAGKIGKVNFKKIKIVDISSDDTQKVKKLFREADLFIAPIFGPGGTRLKILAAMGSGIPVISTETGVEGLDVIDNIHVLTAKTPLQFVEKIEKDGAIVSWADKSAAPNFIEFNMITLPFPIKTDYKVGDIVMAQWYHGSYYSGSIEKLEKDGAIIKWDDGSKPTLVTFDMMYQK